MHETNILNRNHSAFQLLWQSQLRRVRETIGTCALSAVGKDFAMNNLRSSSAKHLLFVQILISCFSATLLHAQSVSQIETGLPFLRNFSPKEYDFHPQNWVITQDSRGIMFIANTAGLLEYDGVTWRRHELFENLTVASLAIDHQGTIFLGGRGELGFLQPDSSGSLNYISLTPYLPENTKNFKIVWETCATTHGIYFRTSRYIFRWNGSDIKTWKTNTSFGYLATVRDTIFVMEKGVGLQTLTGDSLQLIPGGEQFANTTLYVILPFDDKAKIFLGTRTEGIYVYDGRQIQRFKTEADAFFTENRLYHGARLSGAETKWALATTRGGLVVLDGQGKIRQQLNESNGLGDNKIHFVFEDRQGALWLSLNNGISRVEIASPFTIFDHRFGIEGTPHTIARHQGTLFVGTNRGLFRLAESAGTSDDSQAQGNSLLRIFTPVKGISEQVWSLHSTNNLLLVAAARGIYSVKRNRAVSIAELPVATYCFFQPDGQDLIFAGTRDGLAVLELRNGSWHMTGKIDNISEEIRTITSTRDGSLWLGTPFQGLVQVKIDEQFPLKSTVQKYGKEHGLPEGMAYVYAIDGQVKIGTYQGLHRFEQSLQKLIPDSTLGAFLADSTVTINHLTQDKNGIIWAMAGAKKSKLYRGLAGNGRYSWEDTPFQRLLDVNFIMDLLPEETGAAWLVGRDEKIYRIDSNFTSDFSQDFPAHVRRVSTIPGDSLIWGGSTLPGDGNSVIVPVLQYKDNSLRFEYAAASYDETAANQYQIKLDGYDQDYLPWTSETKKDYTGLPAGEYIFRVQARNIYERQSREGSLSLLILSPWYQSWWAWLLYAVLSVTAVVLIVKARVRRLEQKTKQLENLVENRTSVIREQAEKLQELDNMKSRFFANISHEFRTPLTLILGPLEDMLARSKNSSDKKNLGLMQRNARRVLQLINQLLDLSRLESGKLKLQAARGDLVAFLKGIVMSFASLAEQKQIDLQYIVSEDQEDLPVLKAIYFDRDQVEKIFYNLLANAFKFTSEGGVVQVTIINNQRAGSVEIKVKDNGKGIQADRLDNIFKRFYQVDADNTREQEGTGIGLALTKELVELHHGKISVSSEVGKGTEFVVMLPVGTEHLTAEEIVDAPPLPEDAMDAVAVTVEQSPIQPEATKPLAQLNEDDIPIILVVDDHLDVRNYIRSHLELEYRVVEAKDGEEGVKTAAEIIPDMVISDVMMPKLDGYQLCAALKMNEKTSHIPVILLTAKAGEQDKLSGLETGADDYLTKPFNSKELHVRVRNLIELRRRLQKRFQKEGLLKPRAVTVTSVEEAFLTRMMNILEENLGEEDFGVESLSSALHIGRRQLHRKIKALTGETPTDFIRSIRLQRAKQLLEQKSGTVSEIAFQTGFSSLPYFSTAFKDQFGLLPSEI